MGTALSTEDHERALDLIGALTGVETLESFVSTILKGLIELIPSVDVSYNEMNPFAQRAHYEVWPHPGELMEETAHVFERYMRQNPLVDHMERSGDTRTLMWSDFVSIDDMRRTELHKAIYSELGVDSQMAVSLPTPSGIVIGFALNRDAGGFSERDRSVMNTLRPHLVHAYRSVQLHSEVSALRLALSATGWSAALVNEGGEVVGLTDGAQDAMASLEVDLAEGHTLPAPLRRQFVPAIAAYTGADPAVLSPPVRLSEAANGVAAWYVPSPVPPHVVLVKASVDMQTEELVELGLTPREIDVAVALVRGGTNAQLADSLGMAEGTVRKHLERLYATLNVDNRASAAARLRAVMQ